MRKIAALCIILLLSSGCATKKYVLQNTKPLEERISKIEEMDCCGKADNAANKAEAAAQDAREAARKAEEAALNAASEAEKATKAFELEQEGK